MSDFTACPNQYVQKTCEYTGSVADCAVADCAVADSGVAGDCNEDPPTNWNCGD